MSRNLKALGIALAAALALTAVMASAAQAKFDTFKVFPEAEGSAFIKAEASGNQTTSIGTTSVICTGLNLKEPATVKNNTTEITVWPNYTGCKIGGVVNTTVATNGCHYLFTSETTEIVGGSGKEHATVHIVCTKEGESIKIGPTLGCEITVPPQTVHGIRYKNVTTPNEVTPVEREMHVTVEATTPASIKFSSKGCSSLLGLADGEHEGAQYTGNSTILGYKDEAGVINEGIRVGITYETLKTSSMP